MVLYGGSSPVFVECLVAAFPLLVNKTVRHFIYSRECHCKMLVASISLFINGDPYFDTEASGGNL